MDPEVIQILRDAAFTWGGDWKGKTREPHAFSVLHRLLSPRITRELFL
jgi:hypothetical protein